MKQTKVIIISAIVAVVFVFELCEGQLTSASVKEQDCPADFGTRDLLRARSSYDSIPFLGRANLCPYLPMASQFTYRKYAEAFLGRPANNQAELDAMGYRGFTFYNYGYGQLQFFQDGEPYFSPNGSASDKLIVNFRASPVGVIPPANISPLSLITAGAIWTDNTTTVLVVDCLNGDGLDWAVYSINPTIPQSIKDLVLEKIVGYGFDPTKAEYMTYQPGGLLPALCPIPLPLLPFGLGK